MKKTNLTSKVITGNPIRVSVPAAVAFNAKEFKTSVASLMERLGCPTCFSGFDCRFQLQRDYFIDPIDAKIVKPVLAQNSSHNLVNFALSPAKSNDIKQVHKVIDELHSKFGCAPCHSGFDFLFQHRLEEVAQG